MKNIFYFAFSFFFISVNAQQNSWCGTQISEAWMQAFYQRDKSHLNLDKSSLDEVVLPITYHIVGQNNGTGYYKLNELFRSHCELQDLYNNANISFYIHEIDYINNTDYYNGESNYSLFQMNNPNTINVYIIDNMDGVCGYSFVPQNWDGSGWDGPNRGGIMLQKGCMQAGNTTYRHEMGHYLNLPHTFYGWENESSPTHTQNAPNTINGNPVERADGSNCQNSGDGFCDTPPDYISTRWPCAFPRTFLDPLGNQFEVDEKNFMSYSNDGCSQYLSTEQLAETNAAAANHRPYLLTLPAPTFIGLDSITESFPLDNSIHVNSESIVFSWDKQDSADYYQLQITQNNFINPQFDIVTSDTFFIFDNANVNTTYQYRVKPIHFTNVCSNYSAVKTFTTSPLRASTATTNVTCEESADGEAVVTILSNYSSATYTWFSDLNAINPIPFEYTNTISGLSAGSYSVIAVVNNTDSLYITFNIAVSNPLEVEIVQNGSSLVGAVSGGLPPYSISWNNGSSDYTITNPIEGLNYLVVLDQNGCQKIGEFTYTEDISSINESKFVNQFSIAPNPLYSHQLKLTIDATIPQRNAKVRISDVNGKALYSETVNIKEGTNQIILTDLDLAKGFYFVALNVNGTTRTQKLLVLD